jgi:hypothetical protein
MISKQLEWEPYRGAVKPWGAVGAFGDHYWADDNGKWESDPDNSGPIPQDAEEAQAQEDQQLLERLSPEAVEALRRAGLI